mgnify:CR=1 FL=1
MIAFFKRKSYDFDTTAHGAKRAMIPLSAYEDVMPLDLLPVPLLRALAARDTVRAERLGCLELGEEDLSEPMESIASMGRIGLEMLFFRGMPVRREIEELGAIQADTVALAVHPRFHLGYQAGVDIQRYGNIVGRN